MEKSKEFLGTEPIGKLLFKLAIPTVVAQLVNMLYNIVDRIYLGHMPVDGSLALTGVGVCMPIIMVVSAFAALAGGGGDFLRGQFLEIVQVHYGAVFGGQARDGLVHRIVLRRGGGGVGGFVQFDAGDDTPVRFCAQQQTKGATAGA